MGYMMGLFKKKKKKVKQLPLPPAPVGDSGLPADFGDFKEMHPGKKELPSLPPLPDFPPFQEEPRESQDIFPTPFVPEIETLAPLPEIIVREKEVKLPPKLTSKAFIAADDYREIIGSSNVIREKLMAADNHLKKLEELKGEEERLLDKWRSYLEKVEKKMSFVDKIIAKAGEANE